MATINISPTVTVDLLAIENDTLSFPFQVLDDNNSPVNFSGYTSAKLTVKSNELASELISFSSTGSTYIIDICQRSTGLFTVKCNSLAIPSNVYQYDFEVRNASQRITIMEGKFIVRSNITS
jgi:hypothetical protein